MAVGHSAPIEGKRSAVGRAGSPFFLVFCQTESPPLGGGRGVPLLPRPLAESVALRRLPLFPVPPPSARCGLTGRGPLTAESPPPRTLVVLLCSPPRPLYPSPSPAHMTMERSRDPWPYGALNTPSPPPMASQDQQRAIIGRDHRWRWHQGAVFGGLRHRGEQARRRGDSGGRRPLPFDLHVRAGGRAPLSPLAFC